MCRYAALVTLPPGLVQQVNKHNPHVMEVELSRYKLESDRLLDAIKPVKLESRCFTVLICCSNKLTDLPSELAELQQLRVLRVKYNSLTKLPEVLVKMNKLEILELSGNQITALDDKVLTGLHNVRQAESQLLCFCKSWSARQTPSHCTLHLQSQSTWFHKVH